ncbi:MAG TPA: hypothetical protein VGG63_20745, partial [Steroidobacteraceae bacterium]
MAAMPGTTIAAALAAVVPRGSAAGAGVEVTLAGDAEPQLLLLSGETQGALEQASLELREFLTGNQVSMADVA